MSVATSICTTRVKLSLHFLPVQSVPVAESIEIPMSLPCKSPTLTSGKLNAYLADIMFVNIQPNGLTKKQGLD